MSDRRDAVGGEPTPSESDGGTDAEFTLDVPDMDCASCAEKIAGSVRELAGVRTVETHPTTGQVVVGGRVSREAVVERIVAAGYAVAERTVAFQVPEMDCASCADTVEGALAAVAGVHGIDARPTVGRVEVTVGDGTTVDALRRAVEDAGYPVVGEEVDGQGPDGPAAREPVRRSRRAKLTGVAAVLLAVGLVLEFLVPGSNATVVAGPVTFAVADLLFLGAVATGGAAILRNGYYSARNRSLDIDFLMSAAIVSAVVASVVAGTHLYVEAATLSTLFSVAELLERYAMDRTRGSVQELLELAPTEATVRRDGAERTIPAADLVAGDRVVVRPGEKLPADGVVREGESAVNQAPITGESVPVDKTAGDEVYAGTLNESGYLEVDVTAAGGDSTLSKIADLVADADANRTEREQFVERFAAYYTPVMVAVAVLVAAVPPLVLGLDPVAWFVNGITLLVLACPCAFVISTPVSVVSGITAAARNGVLVKGGDHLEAMGGVEAVAVDKTGTLTTGELAVTDIVPLGDHTERDVLRCARGLEARSEHPVGEAIVAHAEGRGAERAAGPVSGFESLTGKGVRATLDGTEHYAGTPALFEELGFDLGHAHVVGDARERVPELRSLCDRQGCLDLAEETIPRLQAEGKTVILVGWEGRGRSRGRTGGGHRRRGHGPRDGAVDGRAAPGRRPRGRDADRGQRGDRPRRGRPGRRRRLPRRPPAGGEGRRRRGAGDRVRGRGRDGRRRGQRRTGAGRGHRRRRDGRGRHGRRHRGRRHRAPRRRPHAAPVPVRPGAGGRRRHPEQRLRQPRGEGRTGGRGAVRRRRRRRGRSRRRCRDDARRDGQRDAALAADPGDTGRRVRRRLAGEQAARPFPPDRMPRCRNRAGRCVPHRAGGPGATHRGTGRLPCHRI